ncbi:hypothetical protein KKF04_02760, partial [Patescibacteria group bacterium]|nr:hypothetical protein [Patescibacteria group bacterium]
MKTLFYYLGYLLIISAFFRIVPIVTALIYDEPVMSFFLAAFLSLALGGVLLWTSRPKEDDREKGLTLSHGLMLAAVSFIVLPLISALSFLSSFDYSYIDAVFESISGFTTTGLTLYDSLEYIPKSLLMWRAMTQWIGGIGIVMVFLFIFSRLHAHDYMHISEAETSAQSTMALYKSQGFTEKMEGGLKKSVTNVMLIYIGYSVIGIILLLIVGLPVYDAIAMTFTSLSTGGFSVNDVFYSNGWQLAILSLLMLIGSISFLTHNKLLQRQWKKFFFAFEKNVFFVFLILIILVTLTVTTDIRLVLFQLISAFTTTGYSISKIAMLPQLFIMMIMAGMMMGGSIASTAGGIKVFRIYYLLRAIPWSIKKLASPPHSVIPLKIHGAQTDEAKLVNIGVFVFLYFLILFAGTVIFMIFGHSFLNASFQIVSALGTVGLQTMELASLNPFLKFVLIIAMLFG